MVAPEEPRFDADFNRRLEQLFVWRRDVRHFRTDSLPEPLVDRLVATMRLSPSVGLSEPWRLVRIRRMETRDAVRAEFERCNAAALEGRMADDAAHYARLKLAGLDRAPCQIAVFVDPDPAQGRGLGRATMPETAAFSAVLAIHTLWLAARAEGIGLGWVSILDPERMKAVLSTPSDWRFVAYLCLGYPDSSHDTPELARLGWEQRAGAPDVIER